MRKMIQEKELILSSRSFDPVKSEKLLSGNVFLLLRDMLKNKWGHIFEMMRKDILYGMYVKRHACKQEDFAKLLDVANLQRCRQTCTICRQITLKTEIDAIHTTHQLWRSPYCNNLRYVWVIMVWSFCQNWGYIMVVTMTPTFMEKVLHFNIKDVSSHPCTLTISFSILLIF